MKRLVSIAAVVALATVVLATGTADAAKPSSGSITSTHRTLRWSGGPYQTSYPITPVMWCTGKTDSNCDHFKFKVNMGQGSIIQVAIKVSTSGFEAIQQMNSLAETPNDLDLAVYDPGGLQACSDGNNTGNERCHFTLKGKYRNKYYEARVVPFLVVPGATYKGTVSVLKYVK